MNTYDVTYVTAPINESLEEQLLDGGLEINVGCHSGLHYVMASLAAEDFQAAATELARTLQDAGVRVKRMDLDLVNQAEIAARCDVSRQAVSKWVATASVVHPFPEPHTLAGGPLWTWSSVNEWLRCTRKACHDDACSPTPEQVDAFNAFWAQRPRVEVQSVPYDELSASFAALRAACSTLRTANSMGIWTTVELVP